MTEREQALITKYDLLFESRLTRVEADSKNLNKTCEELRDTCKEIKTDLRWLLGMTFGMNVAILGIVAKGFHWLQ